MLEGACNYAMETHNALGNSGQCALELMRLYNAFARACVASWERLEITLRPLFTFGLQIGGGQMCMEKRN